MAVTTVPRTTARVTAARRAARSSRRAGSSGTSVAPSFAMARPSRMMKNRMKSITVNESTVPTAPRNAMPPKDASCSKSRLPPSTSQACTVVALIWRFWSSQISSEPTTGICPMSLNVVPCCVPTQACSRTARSAACLANATASAVSGPSNNSRTRIVSVNAEMETRPRIHLLSRCLGGLQQEPDEQRPGDWAEEWLDDAVDEQGDERQARNPEQALVELHVIRGGHAGCVTEPRGFVPRALRASRNRPVRRRGSRDPCPSSEESRGNAGGTRSGPRRARSAARS